MICQQLRAEAANNSQLILATLYKSRFAEKTPGRFLAATLLDGALVVSMGCAASLEVFLF